MKFEYFSHRYNPKLPNTHIKEKSKKKQINQLKENERKNTRLNPLKDMAAKQKSKSKRGEEEKKLSE